MLCSCRAEVLQSFVDKPITLTVACMLLFFMALRFVVFRVWVYLEKRLLCFRSVTLRVYRREELEKNVGFACVVTHEI